MLTFLLNRRVTLLKKKCAEINLSIIRLHISALYLKKYCQLVYECVCCPAPVKAAECHPHHRVLQNDSSQCLQRWSLGKEKKKNKQDRSKFHTPKYIKVTPVSIASKQRNRNCSFLQLGVGLWRGFLVGGETGWEGEHRKLCWVTYRENDDNEKHLVKNPLVWKYDSGVKMRSWHRVKGDKKSRFPQIEFLYVEKLHPCGLHLTLQVCWWQCCLHGATLW